MVKIKVRFLTSVFSMVTTCMVVAVAIFTTVINPVERVEAVLLWQIPGVAALIALCSLIFFWERTLKKRKLVLVTATHYILVNAIVLGIGALFGWFDPGDIRSDIAMVVTIAVIYVIVSGISWTRSVRDAKQMNERLREYMKNSVDKTTPAMYNEPVCEDK